MSYIVAFHPQVRHHLTQIPRSWHQKIEGSLNTLSRNPVSYSFRLKLPWQSFFVYESSPYHILYRLYDREQLILIAAIRTIKY